MVGVETQRDGPLTMWQRLIRQRISFIFLVLTALLIVLSSVFYGLNFFRWKAGPDFGWSVIFQTDQFVLRDVRGKALAAGLKSGDRILKVNGQRIETFRQLRLAMDRYPGHRNYYVVERDGDRLEIWVNNVPLGTSKALVRYGPYWLTGTLFFLLGFLVIIMNPGSVSARAFLSLCFFASLYITWSLTGRLLPDFLTNVLLFTTAFLPAVIIQLASVFPDEKRRSSLYRLVFWSTILMSSVFFATMRISTSSYADLPVWMKNAGSLYLVLAVIIFLAKIFHSVLRAPDMASSIRARVVLLGSVMAIGLPVTHLVIATITGAPLFQKAFLVNLFLYLFFPLSISYAIVRHDLFAIDVFTKRAIGYGLMTVLVGAMYVGLAAFMKPAVSFFPGLERISDLYPVLFAILVVFFFRPIHNRLQAIVDRVFYREKFDYKDAVTSVSSALTSVLDLNEIIVRMIHAVRDIMSVDSAGMILLQPDDDECPALFIHDIPGEKKDEEIVDDCLDLHDPLISLMVREKKLVTVYDLDRYPLDADTTEACARRFEALRCTMILPLIVQDRLTGILALGRKKSGHFFNSEDVDLLTTLANQGAIAIDNASRAERMKEEEVVRANLARYLSPQVVEEVLSKRVAVDLAGSRKDVTVLISDIRGFKEMTKSMPPDELRAVLNEYFTEMAAVIFENRGSLDKYVGDAIVAVFGSLIELENHTAEAVKAAIDMVSRMVRLNRKWAEEFDGFHMDIGIGVDTGEVFLGNVGSPDRMEFTVIGNAVNTAQLLSDTAGPDQILLSEAAGAALGGRVHVKELEIEGIEEITGDKRVLEVVR